MRLRKIRILLQNFSIDSGGSGPLLSPTEKFAHDKACFEATIRLEGAVEFTGRFLVLLVSDELPGHREMLEQFRGRFLLGASGEGASLSLAQRRQNMGISAGGSELGAVSVSGTE